MNTLELIKDAALFGGNVPNERIEEVRSFLDKMNVRNECNHEYEYYTGNNFETVAVCKKCMNAYF